ncbi:hypothetical protein CHS0354_006126 [Potamilus streckersoni]|uniref:HIG1 domain-containing protein n=1 Tax=Potamilus streckersoni TaxID=2493646 RepID=A0AAE0STQ2_9BIVA|nr:hypothetical protein CHS0354_006126 [Potamilus streckersoni]
MATKDVVGVQEKPKTDIHFAYYEPPAINLHLPRSEGTREKFVRKTKENLFVPLGLGVTVFALVYGIYQLKTGNSQKSQKLMRLRVGAQSFTIVAFLGGLVYEARKQARSTPPS